VQSQHPLANYETFKPLQQRYLLSDIQIGWARTGWRAADVLTAALVGRNFYRLALGTVLVGDKAYVTREEATKTDGDRL
jgi:hypothetical protein